MCRLVVLVVAALAILSVGVHARQGILDAQAPPQIRVGDAPHHQPGEGTKCAYNGATGVCQAGPCDGTSVTGKCPGSAAVTCCLPSSSASPVAPTPAPPASNCVAAGGACVDVRSVSCASGFRSGLCAGSSNIRCCVGPTGALNGAPPAPAPGPTPAPGRKLPAVYGAPHYSFPYKFPYSPSRHIVVDFELQRARLYDSDKVVKEYKVSTGAKGIGFTPEYPATPAGKLKIVMKVGKGQPLGEIIEKLTPQHRIGKESDQFAHMQTRILVLEGMDPENRNTRARSIYLHGTNKETQLGVPHSHGCFRFGNKEIAELFDLVEVGTEVYAAPYDAWPKV